MSVPVADKNYHCELLSPEGRVWAGEVTSAVLPATDGQLAVLVNRLPLVSALGAGALRLTLPGSAEAIYYVTGGVARMEANHLTVLAQECIPVEQLDAHDVWEELAEANALPRGTEVQAASRDDQLAAMRVKFKLAQAHGGGKGKSSR